MYRQFAMFTWALFIGLCMIGTLSGCGPTQTKTEKKLSRQDTVALIEELGPAVESAVAAEEEEDYVLNHFRTLWHYIEVSEDTTVTYNRIYYSGWGKETETIHADIELPEIGLIQITSLDNDGSESPGVDKGTIKFSLEVESPEKGTATGEFYPFGGVYQDTEVPPPYNMKMPGGFFVPAGDLLDYTRRHIKSTGLAPPLREMMISVYDFGAREVPRTHKPPSG